MTRYSHAVAAAVVLFGLAGDLEAVVPRRTPFAEKKAFQHAAMYIPTAYSPLGAGPATAFYDARNARVSSMILSVPLVPGNGAGNTLRWTGLGGRPADEGAMKDAAWSAVVGYLQQQQGALRVDVSELGAPRIGIFEHGTFIQVYSQRTLNGIPVRHSSV